MAYCPGVFKVLCNLHTKMHSLVEYLTSFIVFYWIHFWFLIKYTHIMIISYFEFMRPFYPVPFYQIGAVFLVVHKCTKLVCCIPFSLFFLPHNFFLQFYRPQNKCEPNFVHCGLLVTIACAGMTDLWGDIGETSFKLCIWENKMVHLNSFFCFNLINPPEPQALDKGCKLGAVFLCLFFFFLM